MKIDIDSNKEILRNSMPQLYEEIKRVSVNKDEVRMGKARKTDAWILEKNQDGRWVSLYSKFNPHEESEKWAESVQGNPKHIVLFGFGLGYHFEALAIQFPHARFHIVEPDPQLFLLYLEKEGISQQFLSKIEHFIPSNQVEDYKAFFQTIIHYLNDEWAFLSLPKFEKAYPNDFKNYKEAFVNKKKHYKDTALSLHSFEKIWNFNALKNLPQVHESPCIFDFKDQFQEKTVILTASGPSLNDAIPFIKRMQSERKAIIIAAGTSINGLLNKKVQPDLFVSYDPFINNYKALQNVLDAEIPFVFGSTIHPDIPSEYKGAKAYMTTSPDHIARYFNPNLTNERIVQDGPTITAVALDLLNKLGVETVYMAGQDLCFINEKTGAEGVYFYNKEGNATKRQLKNKEYVENNNGEMVLTNQSFLRMKTSIENLMNQINDKMSVYSLSLYGAKIKGVPYRSLEETEAKLLSESRVEFECSWTGTENPETIHNAMNDIEKEIENFSDIKDALERQLERFHTATDNQKAKWQMKIDKSLDRLTLSTGYKEIVYPLVTNRINYMVRLKSNADFSRTEGLVHYYEKGVRPLVDELTYVLDRYNEILSNHTKNQVEMT
ncbi:MAG TPA: 6-hydroxymethylpterin diphosphokinase MptE-like protein [Bacillales bacterium]